MKNKTNEQKRTEINLEPLREFLIDEMTPDDLIERLEDMQNEYSTLLLQYQQHILPDSHVHIWTLFKLRELLKQC